MSSESAGHRIAAGEGHTCVIVSGGRVVCWGRDSIHQSRDDVAPKAVPGIVDARALIAADGVTCVQLARGFACFGDNMFGQLGAAGSLAYRAPLAVAFEPTWLSARAGALGPQGACVIDDSVRCWGEIGMSLFKNEDTRFGRVPLAEQQKNEVSGRRAVHSPRVVPGLEGAAQLAMGVDHLCARMNDGGVRCLGDGRAGQLGHPLAKTIDQLVNHDTYEAAAPVPGLTDVVDIDADLAVTCALDARGAVWCWGSNFHGQLAVPDFATNPALIRAVRFVSAPDARDAYANHPVRIAKLPPARAISVGGTHVCAVLVDGRVLCWGQNAAGQLGDGTTERRDEPTPMNGIRDAVDVAASAYGPEGNTCVLHASGAVSCVGRNGAGELGGASAAALETTPVRVSLPP